MNEESYLWKKEEFQQNQHTIFFQVFSVMIH